LLYKSYKSRLLKLSKPFYVIDKKELITLLGIDHVETELRFGVIRELVMFGIIIPVAGWTKFEIRH